MNRSYSRYRGDYVYDIATYEANPPVTAGVFCAQVMHMVRRESGETVSIDGEFQDEYGATPGEAVLKIETAMRRWVKNHTPSP